MHVLCEINEFVKFVTLYIMCIVTPGALEGTFLANPIISLGLVIAIILLILVMMVVIAMMCVCNSSSSKLKCGNHQQKILSTSSSIGTVKLLKCNTSFLKHIFL